MFPLCAATIVGVYREIAPPADLAAQVACVWTSVSRGGVILPDGCVDIVWRGDRLVVAGPATGPVPAACPRACRCSACASGSAWRGRARRAGGGVPGRRGAGGRGLGPGVEERVAAGGLAALLAEVRARGSRRWTRSRGRRRWRWRARARAWTRSDLGVSERQLRRRFVDAVGYGPKTLARVLRFQRFLALATGDAGASGRSRRATPTRRISRASAGGSPGARPRSSSRRGADAAGERVRFVQAADALDAYRAA